MSSNELRDKVVFITGASRGIGREIGLNCAKLGAKVVVAAKTTEAQPNLSGTIYSVAEEIVALGAEALSIQLDVRDEGQIEQAVTTTIEKFGQIDVLVNNASAIALTPIMQTPMRRFDLMQAVNTRGTFAMCQACIPYLEKSSNPHILTMSPPLSLQPKWFSGRLAYTISKYGMSMCTLGLSEELRSKRIAVNSLWPKTTIATAAIKVHFPPAILQASRTPNIVADAAVAILQSNSIEATGNFYIDEDVLRKQGINDFKSYAVDPSASLMKDLYLD